MDIYFQSSISLKLFNTCDLFITYNVVPLLQTDLDLPIIQPAYNCAQTTNNPISYPNRTIKVYIYTFGKGILGHSD